MAAVIGFVVMVAAFLHLAPQLTRRDIFFGVTVPSGFRDDRVARTVSRRYAVEIWGLALVAAAFAASTPFPAISGPTLLAQTIGGLVAFARARSAVLPHGTSPATTREADLSPRQGLPGGWLAQLGPFLVLCAAAAYAGWNWESIPARFPTHWNLGGAPNGWTAKSPGGVFRGLGVGFVLCGTMLFTSYAVLRWTRLPRVTGVDGAEGRRVRHANLLAMLATEYLVAALLTWTTVVSMFSDHGDGARLPLAFRVAPFALAIGGGLAIRGMRHAAARDMPPVGDTTHDAHWWFGHLYVARADPALFVEKRVGLGYTLNLGNPFSWLVLLIFAGALAVPLVIVP